VIYLLTNCKVYIVIWAYRYFYYICGIAQSDGSHKFIICSQHSDNGIIR